MSKRKKLTISLVDMIDAIAGSIDGGMEWYLDQESGEVTMFSTEEPSEQELADDERYLSIPAIQSQEQFALMCEFADTLHDEDVRERFARTLGGRGSPGRFLTLLDEYPDLKDEWYEMRNEEHKRRATDWLQMNNIEPEWQLPNVLAPPREQKRPEMQPGLIEVLMLGERRTEDGTEIARVTLDQKKAQKLFKKVAKDICEHYGMAWRERYVVDVTNFEMENMKVEIDDQTVEVRVRITDEIRGYLKN